MGRHSLCLSFSFVILFGLSFPQGICFCFWLLFPQGIRSSPRPRFPRDQRERHNRRVAAKAAADTSQANQQEPMRCHHFRSTKMLPHGARDALALIALSLCGQNKNATRKGGVFRRRIVLTRA
jgi:hypothetical protein